MAVTMTVSHDSMARRYAATFDADRLRVNGIPFDSVEVSGCCDVTLVLRGDATTARFVGRLAGDSLTGCCGGSERGRFAYSRARAEPRLVEEREITFSSGA
jgi:hypothetical protein